MGGRGGFGGDDGRARREDLQRQPVAHSQLSVEQHKMARLAEESRRRAIMAEWKNTLLSRGLSLDFHVPPRSPSTSDGMDIDID